ATQGTGPDPPPRRGLPAVAARQGIPGPLVVEAARRPGLAAMNCSRLSSATTNQPRGKRRTAGRPCGDDRRGVGADCIHREGAASTNQALRQGIRRCRCRMAVEYTPLGAIPTIRDGIEFVRAGLMID